MVRRQAGSLSYAIIATRSQSAAAGLAILLVLMVVTTTVLLFGPSLVGKAAETRRIDEEQRLKEIADAFVASIRLTGNIPGPANWPSVVAEHAGMNQTNVESVYAEFPADTSTRRVLLIDPSLGSTNLPYAQGYNGLTDGQTNLFSSTARLMLISSSRRGLNLPVTNGPASSATAFNNIWNWGLNAATKAPPSGWPAAWNGRGDELHVQRIPLHELFHLAKLDNVLYAVGTNLNTVPAFAPLSLLLLNSTLLTVYDTNGGFYRAQRLTKDVRIELAGTNAEKPVAFFKFSETSGAVATNDGTYASLWNGVYTNGVLLAQTNLRPPTYAGFATNNYSAYFDGNKAYVETGRRYTNYLPAFTFAAWIAPAQFNKPITHIAGIKGSIHLNLFIDKKGSNFVRLSTKRAGNLATHYPYPMNEWHHFAVTASGGQFRSYIDGEFKKALSKSTLNYYFSNLYTFRIGANPIMKKNGLSWGSAPQYKGGIDEVVFYHRVLTTNEIKSLANGVVP